MCGWEYRVSFGVLASVDATRLFCYFVRLCFKAIFVRFFFFSSLLCGMSVFVRRLKDYDKQEIKSLLKANNTSFIWKP